MQLLKYNTTARDTHIQSSLSKWLKRAHFKLIFYRCTRKRKIEVLTQHTHTHTVHVAGAWVKRSFIENRCLMSHVSVRKCPYSLILFNMPFYLQVWWYKFIVHLFCSKFMIHSWEFFFLIHLFKLDSVIPSIFSAIHIFFHYFRIYLLMQTDTVYQSTIILTLTFL